MWDRDKQCGPRSDAVKCGAWSRSPLLECSIRIWIKMKNSIQQPLKWKWTRPTDEQEIQFILNRLNKQTKYLCYNAIWFTNSVQLRLVVRDSELLTEAYSNTPPTQNYLCVPNIGYMEFEMFTLVRWFTYVTDDTCCSNFLTRCSKLPTNSRIACSTIKAVVPRFFKILLHTHSSRKLNLK